MTTLYDRIGVSHSRYRRPDPRIAAVIHDALGNASSIVNIGAGVGSYEPSDRDVVAVEISETMIGQRPPGSAPALCASAMTLPLSDKSFDAALALLTVHHWPNLTRGMSEMRRVARDVCILLTWEPPATPFWLTRDYFPEILAYDRTIFPPVSSYRAHFRDLDIRAVPIPHDCRDGFLCAYWRRPEVYLDDAARGAISSFARIDVREGLAKLRRDLADGTWASRNEGLAAMTELDLGYRLVVGRS